MFIKCVRSNSAEGRQARGLLPGKSPLTVPQGDHMFATFACKRSEKQPFADDTALLEAPDRVCPDENRHAPPVGEGRFFSPLRPRNPMVACSLTGACPG
jgi:hypothetical protein